MRIRNLRQTCMACPSQWEAETADGEHLYVRYRWGHLTHGMGADLDDAVAASFEDPGQQLGDGLDGDLSTEKMLRALDLER